MKRPDAPAKVRGSVRYGTDLELPGSLFGALVPAPVARGRLVAVDLAPARAHPGVVAAVGPWDLAGLLPGGGSAERPVFPRTDIAYRGQPVAAVAAESLSAARDAAKKAVVTVSEAEPTLDLEALFPEWPGPEGARSPHVIAHVRARHGDLERAFLEADQVHAETYRTSGVLQVPLEPHACLARVDDGTFRVTTSTQSPFGIREDAAEILGIPEESLVVEGTWVGGGFGSKNSALLEPIALVLAKAAARPVKLALSYPEEFAIGRATLPAVVRIESAVRSGRLSGRRVRLLLDAGASLPGRDFATGYAIGFLLGPYRVGAFEMEGYAVRTNKPPFGPHRAPLAPQCAFVVDSHMDSLARRLGVDPVAFRLAHAWTEGDETPMGQRVGPFGLEAGLRRARATIARWRRTAPRGHGFGVGVGFWSTGTGAGGEARVRVTPREVVVEQVEHEIGSGSVAAGLVGIASRVLGVPPGAVRLADGDTASAPFDSGVFGSRTVGALGQAVGKAADAILKELARRLGTKARVRLVVERGRLIAVAGRRRSAVRDLLTPAEREGGGLVELGQHYGPSGSVDERRVVEGTFYPYTDFTAAVQACEVDVDRETGAIRVVRFAAFPDAGVVLDDTQFLGQVEGGVAMGLGTALTEEAIWTPEGRLQNAGLLDYRVPTLGEVPPIVVAPVVGFEGAGPLGAKGIGEPPIIPVPAAVANALVDATGARSYELPLTPERVARALKLL